MTIENILETDIPVENKGAATRRLLNIQRKAIKLGFEPIKFTYGEEFTVKSAAVNADGHSIIYTRVPLKVEGVMPVLDGWVLRAHVERLEEGDIISPFHDDFQLPAAYRNYNGCEHCNTNRARKYTYVIQHTETNEYMQVGKACLKDYIDVDISSAMSYYRMMHDIRDSFADGGDLMLESENHGQTGFDVRTVLDLAFSDVDYRGYHKTDSDLSTKDTVLYDLMKFKQVDRSEHTEAMIEWVMSNGDESDFMTSVRTLVKSDFVTDMRLGYIVGAIPSYLRSIKEETVYADAYFGEPKKRGDIEVTLEEVRATFGHFGETYIHKFKSDEGHLLTWFSSSKDFRDVDGVQIGSHLTIKATVKNHEVYNNQKQTTITRVVIK